jgi:DNA mismatch repair protein MLH3
MTSNLSVGAKGRDIAKQDGRIKALPKDVVAKVKSSATITNLNHVILGLLENALDAGARKIDIQVQESRGSCTVEDDGYGIPPVEFAAQGGLGKMNRKQFSHAKLLVPYN